MVETLSGEYVVKPAHKFVLVVAEFNRFITAKLAEGAVDCLLRHGIIAPDASEYLALEALRHPATRFD